MSGQPLVIKFGADIGPAQASIAQLAASAARNFSSISETALETSKTLRNELVSGAAAATSAIGKQIFTLQNFRTAAGAAGEGLKIAFALHHPVLAIGLQLLSQYRALLGGVAAGALTAVEALKLAHASFANINDVLQKSAAIGVSPTLFQVWSQQAEHTKLTVEQMEAALAHAAESVRPTFDAKGSQQVSEFVKLSDELQNGKGFATQSFQAFKDAGDDMDKLVQAAAFLVTDLQHVEAAPWNLETVLRGANERLIPIVMTAAVTALGLLPLALALHHPGQEIEGPMAVTVLGGLLTSTLLNLLVLPSLAERYAAPAPPP